MCTKSARGKNIASNHLSIRQWICFAIHDSQQPTSYSYLLSLKLPPPPCAVHTGSYVGMITKNNLHMLICREPGHSTISMHSPFKFVLGIWCLFGGNPFIYNFFGGDLGIWQMYILLDDGITWNYPMS